MLKFPGFYFNNHHQNTKKNILATSIPSKLRKTLRYCFLFLLIAISPLFVSSCENSESRAKKVLAEAINLVESGKSAEGKSYGDALKYYVEAQVKIERLLLQYPKSKTAEGIRAGEIKIGSHTISELNDTVIPNAKFKAEGVESPISCAILIVPKIKESSKRAMALAYIASKYGIIGDKLKCENIMSQSLGIAEAKKTAWRFPPYLQDLRPPLSEIALRYAEAGYFEQAKKCAEKIEDQFYKCKSYTDIAGEYAKIGDNTNALATISQAKKNMEQVLDPLYRAFSMIGIAKVYTNVGKKKESLEVLLEAVPIAKLSQSPSDQVFVLDEIALQYYRLGKKEKAISILSDALQIISEEKTTPWKTFVMGVVGKKFADIGEFEKAIQIAKKLDEPAEKILTCVYIAKKVSAMGNKSKSLLILEEALKEAEKIKVASTRSSSLACIAGGYRELGEKERAFELLRQSLKESKMIVEENKRDYVLSRIAQEYADIKQFDVGLEVAGEIRDTEEKTIALIGVCEKSLEAGSFIPALRAAKNMENPFDKTKALADISLKMNKAGQNVDDEMRKVLYEIVKDL